MNMAQPAIDNSKKTVNYDRQHYMMLDIMDIKTEVLNMSGRTKDLERKLDNLIRENKRQSDLLEKIFEFLTSQKS